MEKTSAWAALYFIALMTFGNYVLFNLLVAILVEGFSTEVSHSNGRHPLDPHVLPVFRKAAERRKVEAAPIDWPNPIRSKYVHRCSHGENHATLLQTQALITGDVQAPGNAHEFPPSDANSTKFLNQETKLPRTRGTPPSPLQARTLPSVSRGENHEHTENCHQQRG